MGAIQTRQSPARNGKIKELPAAGAAEKGACSMKFLDAALQGRNDLWRYLLGIGVIMFAVFFIGGLPLVAAVVYMLGDGNPATDFNTTTGALVGMDPLLNFVLNLLPFEVAFVAIGAVVVYIH